MSIPTCSVTRQFWRVIPALLAAVFFPRTSAFEYHRLEPANSELHNAISDSSFEAGTWRAQNGARLVSPGRTGAHAAVIERRTEKETPMWQGKASGLSAGTWLLSGWLRSWATLGADRNFSAEINVRWFDADSRELGRSRGLSISGTFPEWTFQEASVIAPEGTASAAVEFSFTGPIVGRVEADDLCLIPAADEGTSEAGPVLRVECRPTASIFPPGSPLELSATLWATDGVSHPVWFDAVLHDSAGKAIAHAQVQGEVPGKWRQGHKLVFEPIVGEEIPTGEWMQAQLTVQDGTATGAVIGSAGCGFLVLERPDDTQLKSDSPFALLVGHAYTKRWLGARWERPNIVNERLLELPRRYGVICMPLFNVPYERIDDSGVAEDLRARVSEYVRTNAAYLDYLQIGNEPALFRPGVTEQYVKALRIGWEAAKAAKPDIIISAAGITGLNVDEEMVARLLDAGAAQYCDMLDIHTYLPLAEMDRIIAKVRRQMAERGVEKPLIITEVTANLGAPIPEREKAGHVYKRYAVALSHGVSQVYWFVMHWVNDLPGGFRYCGLIDSANHAPWPAAAAYSALARELENMTFSRRQVDDGMWCFEFRGGQRQVLIAWSDIPGRALLLGPGGIPEAPPSSDCIMIDVSGRRRAIPARGETVIPLTSEPVLLTMPEKTYSIVQNDEVQLAVEATRPAVARGSEVVFPVAAQGTFSQEWQSQPYCGVDARTVIGTGSVRILADGNARLGEAVPVIEGTIDSRNYLIRIPVEVTDPLRISAIPMPDPDGSAALSVTIENTSMAPLEGVLTAEIPISKLTRSEPLTYAFSDLAPGARAAVNIPLSGSPGSLTAYPCRVHAETRGGARASWSRSLVFVPARRLTSVPRIDGDVAEWGEWPIRVGVDTGARRDAPGSDPETPGDLSARGAVAWDTDALYLAVCVVDDKHLNKRRDGSLWDGDSIQVGLAVDPGVPEAERLEMSVGLGAAGAQGWIHRNFAGKATGPANFPVGVVRTGTETRYEMAIPWTQIPVKKPGPGTWLGVGLVVNESDDGKRGWLGWHHGIATDKNPALFGQVTLIP